MLSQAKPFLAFEEKWSGYNEIGKENTQHVRITCIGVQMIVIYIIDPVKPTICNPIMSVNIRICSRGELLKTTDSSNTRLKAELYT